MAFAVKPRLWFPGLVPLLLIGIGVLHSVFGFWAGSVTLRDMARDGLWNSIHSEPGPPSRSLLLWFLLSGFFMIMLGHLGLWVERRLKQPLPVFFAVEFLVVSSLAMVVMGGASQGWIFMLAGSYVLVVRLARRPPEVATGSRGQPK